MKKIIIVIVIMVAVLVAAFFALNSYIYNEKQGEADNDSEVIVG